MRAYQTSPPTKQATVDFQPRLDEHTYETSYRLWGSLKSGPPLICLHGGPGHPSVGQDVFHILYQVYGLPVILYDQLGCGRSTRLPEKRGDTEFWTIELFISELKNLIEKLGITDHFIFGHSWGGILGGEYALTQPKGLQKLVLYANPSSTAVRVRGTEHDKANMPGDIPAIFKKYEEADQMNHPEYVKAFAEFFKRHMCRIESVPPPLAQALADFRSDSTVYSTMYGSGPLNMTGPLKDYDIRPRLRQITDTTVPGGILLMSGRYDSAAEEKARPFFTDSRARVKWVWLAESSHMGYWEETDLFFSLLAAFLKTP